MLVQAVDVLSITAAAGVSFPYFLRFDVLKVFDAASHVPDS